MSKLANFLIALLLLSQIGWIASPQVTRPLRVCAYENAPKIYTDQIGAPAGFWPDLLNAIAQKEAWTLTWKHGSWNDCLAWLKDNQVDVVPDMGWTPDRSQIYAFSNETVLTSWTRLYAPVGSQISSILDLNGKTIAGLKGSFNMDGPEGIKDLVDKFGLHATFIEMESYTQVFEALDRGTVDAGITNKDFGNLNEGNYRVERTSILFQPARIQFAFTKDAPLTPMLIERINADMQTYKADPSSTYYSALDQYLGTASTEPVDQTLPGWLRTLALGGIGLILFLLAVSIVARMQVRRRTAALLASQERSQAIFDSVNDAILIHNAASGAILDVNRRMNEMFGYSHAEALRLTVGDISAGEPGSTQADALAWIQKASEGQPQLFEWHCKTKQGGLFWGEVNMRAASIDGGERILVAVRDITERKRAEQAERAQRTRFEIVAAANAALTQSLDLDSVLNTLLETLHLLVPYDTANVMLLENEHFLRVHATRGYEKFTDITATEMIVFDVREAAALAPILQDRNSLIVADSRLFPGWQRPHGAEHVISWMGVPLIAAGRMLGIFSVDKVEANFFTDQHRQDAEALAAQAAVALENARLLATERTQRGLAEALRDATIDFNRAATVDDVYDAVIAHLDRITPHDACDVMEVTDGIARLVRVVNRSGRGFDMATLQETFTLAVADTADLRQMAETGNPLLIEDTALFPGWVTHPETAWVRARIGTPVRVHGQLFGFIFAHRALAHGFDQADAENLRGLAEQTATALENIQLLEQVRTHAAKLEERVAERTAQLEQILDRQRALAEIELAINEPKEAQAALDRIVQSLTDLLPASGGASVLLWDKQSETFTASASTVPDQPTNLEARAVRRSAGATRWIVDHAQPLLVSELSEDPFGANSMLTRYDLQAYAGFPLIAESEPVGVLYALFKEKKRLSQKEQEFMSSLAVRAAFAISKVRLVEQITTANRRLESQAQRLTSANQELEGFTYTVSHDLKAPLRGIAGYANELTRRHSAGLSERALFCIQQILTATGNLDALIEDLLHYSRLEREAPMIVPIDVQTLIASILKDQHALIEAHHAQVTVDLPFQTVPGWHSGLTQVFSNLIGNALKYSRNATPPQVKIGGEELAGAYRLSVRDNGIGFEMKYHDRIFGLFNRLVRPDEFEGTGAGLAIVQKVVQKLGGKVWAESSLGAGSTFFVEIPKQG